VPLKVNNFANQDEPWRLFLNHFDPQFQGQIFALGDSKLSAKLFFVTSFEYRQIERNGPAQVLCILTITL